MVDLQGLDVCVNLKNGDVIYGIVTGIDDEDGSISLEKVERCFTSGRKSDYPFMKIPGHTILNYNPKTAPEMSKQKQPQPEQPQQQPQPAQVSHPVSTTDMNAFTPSDVINTPTKSSLDNQGPAQKSTFVDPAIISITSEKTPAAEKRSKKQQHSPGATKSNKVKKDTQNTVTGDDTNDTTTAAPPTKSNKTTKSSKSKRSNKSKQAQSSAIAQEDGDGKKSVKSPPAPKSSSAKGGNANKKSSKRQQRQEQQQQQQHQPFDQGQLSPQQKQPKQSQPPQQHVIPQFGNQMPSRKLVDTVESYDFDEFATTSGNKDGYQNSQPRFVGAKQDQQDSVATYASHNAMPEPKKTSQLHKPDDAVNQAATQSLLSSLNMVNAFPSPSEPRSSHESPSSASYQQASSVGYTTSAQHTMTATTTTTSTNAFALNMPFPMPKPTVYTGDTMPQPFQTATNGEKRTTPTKTMVPLLDDGSPAAAHDSTTSATASITSPASSLAQAVPKTYVLQQEQPTEKLQKPMEDEDSEPILTYKNDNHANSYDGPIIRSVATGAACPVLSVELLSRLIHITKSEAGLNEAMMTENAAHATTSMTFKMIGGQRRVQQQNHNDAPIVVILAGSHSVGGYGIATARHLANRGIQVVVLLVSLELEPQIKEQKRCAQFAGVTFVDSVDELPDPLTAPVDLIIDAMMGSFTSMHDLKKNHIDRSLLWQSIDWSNGNKAPILSLDYPSGVNHEDGHPFHVMHYILPKWTICFGAPIQGCISDKVTGGLFVADIGIPAVSWQRIGIKGRGLPWGVESVMPLEYE